MTFRRRRKLETLEAYRAAFETVWKRRLASNTRQLWRDRLARATPENLPHELRETLSNLQWEFCSEQSA